MESNETSRPKRMRLTIKQGLVMVQYMNEHKDFACSKINDPNSRIIMMKRWKELADLLNKEGPQKSEEEWRRVWTDMKGKVQSKTSQVRSESLSPARMQGESPGLSKVDQIVLSIIGPQNTDSCMENEASQGNECNVSQEYREEDGNVLILPYTLLDPEVIVGNTQDVVDSQPVETSIESSQPENGIDEAQRGMQSQQRNKSNERYLRAMAGINKAVASITQTHIELLKLKMGRSARSDEQERLKLQNQRNIETKKRTMVDQHPKVAVASKKKNEGVTVSHENQIQAGEETGNPSPIDGQDRGSSPPSPDNLHSRNATTDRKKTENVGGSLNDVMRWIDDRMTKRSRKTEHSIFGDYVVSEIQKLTDPCVLATAKNDIQKALFEASLKQIEIDRSKQLNQQLQRGEASNASVPSSFAVYTRSPEDPVVGIDTSQGQTAENSLETSAIVYEDIIELS